MPVFFVLAASLSIRNNYGIISLLSSFTLTFSPTLLLSIHPSFFDLQYMARSLIAGVSRLSFSQSVAGCVCMEDVKWNGAVWIGCVQYLYKVDFRRPPVMALCIVCVCVMCVYCI